MPKLLPEGQQNRPGESTRKSFYKSLDLLARFYGIPLMETRNLNYPYNMAVALWDVERILEETRQETIRVFFEKGQQGYYITSEETYNTGRNLYYIPVIPLYKMLKKSKRRKHGRLLLCVFAYLYQVAGIPYYRREDSYMYWTYDMIAEWMIENPGEWEEQDYRQQQEQYDRACSIGDRVERKISNPALLEQFPATLERFVVQNRQDERCYRIAHMAYALYKDYPGYSIFRHALWDTQEREDDAATMNKYISFVAETVDNWLFDTLKQAVNDDLGQYMEVEEPTITRVFNTPETPKGDDLGFECRVFPLLEFLCEFLNDTDNE